MLLNHVPVPHFAIHSFPFWISTMNESFEMIPFFCLFPPLPPFFFPFLHVPLPSLPFAVLPTDPSLPFPALSVSVFLSSTLRFPDPTFPHRVSTVSSPQVFVIPPLPSLAALYFLCPVIHRLFSYASSPLFFFFFFPNNTLFSLRSSTINPSALTLPCLVFFRSNTLSEDVPKAVLMYERMTSASRKGSQRP